MVKVCNKVVENNGEPDFVSIDECEELMKEKASFFNNIICFLERNEKRIIEVLGNKRNAKTIDSEVIAIEVELTDADKLVNKMDDMIRSSQQVYSIKKVG
ncbi:MAG: hypothetical protein EOP47_26575 [Sphingobacteriaceae bacterium]|nr:MAG: hypothetical protein EOP47_26575 [Sphingobacteriaceae bacterium]